MSLDLGALVGSVILESTQFDRTYTRVVRQMGDLAATAEKTAAGTTTLDEALIGVGTSAGKAAAGLDRTTQASRASATAEQRAAAAAERHAQAVAQVAGTLTAVADESPRVQAATLRVTAAQERLNLVNESGTATTRQLALANAGLISAQRSLVVAQEAGARSAGRFSGALMGTLKMAAELGLLIGGIEIAKKAIEFVAAGKELTDALNGVQAASHATDAQMKGVRAEAIALGKDLTIPTATAVDAAKAIEDLVRAGMSLPRALAAARPALLLASAAQVSTADAARFLGDTLDDFQLPAKMAAHVANSLAGAATSAGGGLTDMFEAIKYSGPFARAAGVDVDSLVAAIAELAKGGIQGSMAGTGVRMMLQKLAQQSPVTVRALHDLGVEAWDAQGRFVGLPKVIDQLHAAQDRLNPEQFLRDISLAFGARASTVVASFAHKGIEGYNQFLARVKSGDVQQYANLMNRGVGAGFRQLGKEATAAGIDVYQNLEPRLTTAVMWIGTNVPKAVHEAQSALSPLEHFVGGALSTSWHLFAGAVGIAVTVLGPVVHLLEDLKTPLGAVAVLAGGAWLGFQGARAAGLLVMNLISIVKNLPAAMVAMAVSARESTTATALSFAGIGNAAKTSAVATTAAMTDIEVEAALMSGTIVAEGEAASIGWAGLLGPLGAVAVGIGLLVTMFHHSSGASKEATDAAKAYTDALKGSGTGGNKTDLNDAIVTQLANNKVPEAIANLNLLSQGMHQFKGTDFVDAITEGGTKLKTLRAQLEANIATEKKLQATQSNTSISYAATGYAITTAKKLLKDLDTQYSALSKAAQKDLIDTKAFAGVSSSIDKVSQSTQVGSDTAKKYAAMLGIYTDKNGIAAVSSTVLANAVKTVSKAYNLATQTGDEYLAALSTFAQSEGTAADRATLIGATLKAANGDALSFAGALAGTTTAIDAMTGAFAQQSQTLATQSKDQSNAAKAVTVAQQRLDAVRGNSKATAAQLSSAELSLSKAQQSAAAQGALAYSDTERAAIKLIKTSHGWKASIDTNAKGAGDLVSQLQGIQSAAMAAAGAMYQHELATKGGKAAADDAYKIYVSKTRGALIDQAKALHLTAGQAKALADQYFGMPADVKTLIEQEGANPVVDVLNKIGKLLAAFTGQPWDVTVTANVNPALDELKILEHGLKGLSAQGAANLAKIAAGMTSGRGMATGGLVNGPGTGTSDTAGLFHLSNREFVSTAAAVARNLPALEAANRGATLTVAGGYGVSAPTFSMPASGGYNNRQAARFAPTSAGDRSITVHQTIQNPLPEPASASGPEGLRRAAATFDL